MMNYISMAAMMLVLASAQDIDGHVGGGLRSRNLAADNGNGRGIGNGGNGNDFVDDNGSCPRRNNPVCADGITYQNACLAISQGDVDYTNGPCIGGDAPSNFHQSNSGSFTREQMGRFNEENFKLVGQVEMIVPTEPVDVTLDGLEPSLSGDGTENKVPPGLEKNLSRVTKDGYLYVTKDHQRRNNGGGPPDEFFAGGLGEGPPIFAPGFEHGDDNEMRKLWGIFGTDDRTEVTQFSWPHWRVGQVELNGVICSGAIIGENKVVTAAHCVYDAVNRNWISANRFAPGRLHINGRRSDPWGTWPVEYTTIMTAWTNTGSYDIGDVKYDVAVLTMGPGWAGEIGSYMGALPVVPTPCTIDSQSRSSGYPGDKPYGSLWDTGVCPNWSYQCGTNTVLHQCDVQGGQSGSVMYDSAERVFAVLSGASTIWNAAYAFDGASASYVPSWGG